MTIDVVAVLSLPTSTDQTVTTNEDATYTFAITDFSFSDFDAGDTLQSITIVTLPGAGSLDLFGVGPVFAGQVITPADVTANNLRFTPAPDGNGAGYASFTFTVSDGVLSSAPANTMTIDVTSINDIPFLVNNNPSVGPEGGPDTISAAELRFDDADQLPTSIAYTVTTLPARGQLELTTAPTVAITSFTQDDIANNRVVYVHDGSETTSDSFDFDVDDGPGNTLAGQSFSLTITAANDAPVHSAPGAAATPQNTGLVFSGAAGNQISIGDADAGASLIEVTLTATNGTITIGDPARDGTELLVNTTTFGDQQKVAVAMDASGNLVVVWESAGQDNPDGKKGIYAQRFDANGVAQGSEFLVNTTTADGQQEPAIAMDGSGNFEGVGGGMELDGER